MTTIRKFMLFGFRVTVWRWAGEKRLGTPHPNGIGIIIER